MIDLDPIQRPPIKTQPSIPKKKRRRAPKEAMENPYKIKKKYKESECSKCGETSHNVRTYKGPHETQVRRRRRRRRHSHKQQMTLQSLMNNSCCTWQ